MKRCIRAYRTSPSMPDLQFMVHSFYRVYDKRGAKRFNAPPHIKFFYRLLRLNNLSTVTFLILNSWQSTLIIRKTRNDDESTDWISPIATR